MIGQMQSDIMRAESDGNYKEAERMEDWLRDEIDKRDERQTRRDARYGKREW